MTNSNVCDNLMSNFQYFDFDLLTLTSSSSTRHDTTWYKLQWVHRKQVFANSRKWSLALLRRVSRAIDVPIRRPSIDYGQAFPTATKYDVNNISIQLQV